MSNPRTPHTIPKIIHVIWAGGEGLMPESGMENVLNWVAANPDFQLWIWIDKVTTQNVVARYAEKLRELNPNFNVTDGQSATSSDNNQSIILLKDIKDEGFRDEYVSYEIDKTHPNFGCSSDLLRYAVLKFGGVYIDCTDVYPNEEMPLINSSLFLNSHNTHILGVDHCSQKNNPSPDRLRIFNKQSLQQVGNDSFASTANNPLMHEFLARAIKKYDDTKENPGEMLRLAHENFNIKSLTIERTGPELIKEILKDYAEEEKQEKQETSRLIVRISGEEVLLFPLQSLEARLVIPSPQNSLSWLKPIEIWKFNNISRDNAENFIFEKIKRTIIFEIEHFNILRLDDHIKDYIFILSKYKPELINEEPEQVAQQLISRLRPIDLTNEVYVQITGTYQSSVNFCLNNEYKCLYNLTAEALDIALQFQTNLGYVSDFILSLKPIISRNLIDRINENSDIDTQRKETAINILQSNHIPSLEEFMKLAETAHVDLLASLPRKLDEKFPHYIDKLVIGLKCLEQCMELKGLFNDLPKIEVLKPIIDDFSKYGEILNAMMQRPNKGLTPSLKVKFPIKHCDKLLSNYHELRINAAVASRNIQEPISLRGFNPG